MATMAQDPSSLAALRILVIEDEFFLADDVAAALARCGATVLGPVASVGGATAAIERDSPDCALVDVNLGGDMAFPLARRLRAEGIPFVFATGYGADALPPEFAGTPHIEKPFNPDAAVVALTSLIHAKGCG